MSMSEEERRKQNRLRVGRTTHKTMGRRYEHKSEPVSKVEPPPKPEPAPPASSGRRARLHLTSRQGFRRFVG
jgi:hypothetical protein